MFLMETKSGKVKMERVGRKLGYFNSLIVDAKGTSWGIALLWTNDFRFDCNWSSERVINEVISDEHGTNL